MLETIEKIVSDVSDLLISNIASWSNEKQKEVKNECNLSLYVNDYLLNYLEMQEIELSKNDIELCYKNILSEVLNYVRD